jgi:hypothetical protein
MNDAAGTGVEDTRGRAGPEEDGMGARRIGVAIAVAIALLCAAALGAAKVHEFKDLGLRLAWDTAVKARPAGGDVVVEGGKGGVSLKIVVRKGERLGRDTHEFRLVSYFPGEWKRIQEDCRGKGWDGCDAWTWKSERGGLAGIGMAGYGPSGTYFVVLSFPGARFDELRPAARVVQESIELFWEAAPAYAVPTPRRS